MKLSLTSSLCILLTIIVAATVALASCNDSPAVSTQTHQARPTVTPMPTSVPLPSMSLYQTGMVAPAWSHDAYSNYTPTLHAMKQATSARWVELPILLQQATSISTHVDVSKNQVTPQSLAVGIQSAHKERLRVFVVPLLGVNVAGDWAGTVEPTDISAWFTSYWQALEPYVNVAEQAQADQLSIGTEENWLQNNANGGEWARLIGRITDVYHGRLTYDTNWSEMYKPVPLWMHDGRLSAIGVSEYIDLAPISEYIDPAVLPARWKSVIQSELDQFSVNTGKPLIISEIGYRDRADALWHAWSTTSTADKSQVEQAGAFDAALTDLQGDSHIVGFYPWGWQGTGDMSLKGTQSTNIIRHHYQTM